MRLLKERNAAEPDHVKLFDIFLEGKRQYPKLASRIAVILQKLVLSRHINEDDSSIAISIFLQAEVSGNYEEGLQMIWRYDLLVHHSKFHKKLVLKAMQIPLLSQEFRDVLSRVLIRKIEKDALTEKQWTILSEELD